MTLDQAPLSSEQYHALAALALQQYALRARSITFIQHNAGVVFRVVAESTHQPYLLKLHMRQGQGTNPSAEPLEVGMRWLAGVALQTDIAIQTPIPSALPPFQTQSHTT